MTNEQSPTLFYMFLLLIIIFAFKGCDSNSGMNNSILHTKPDTNWVYGLGVDIQSSDSIYIKRATSVEIEQARIVHIERVTGARVFNADTVYIGRATYVQIQDSAIYHFQRTRD